jgi:hypothetical protein
VFEGRFSFTAYYLKLIAGMETIFDKTTRSKLISRINSLTGNSKAQWGKMNIHQMTKHCIFWDDWVQGKTGLTYKQEFIGLIFGKIALRSVIKDDRPLKRNMPAGKKFIIKDKEGDIEQQKKNWVERIAAYEHFSNPGFIHDFFGKMTVDQIGVLAYKHADHHLRQFNA